MKDNYALSASTNFALPEPNLRTPYVQQWSFGIEQDVKGAVVSLRYVGNHGTKLLRNIDYNQVDISRNGFVDDFKRARNNGFLAEKATRSFNPAYDPNIPGSQPLTVFPLLPNGGMLTNATVIRNLRQGEAGTLASFYHTSRANGSLNFFPNPTALSAFSVGNFSNSTYNSLQFDVRRPMKRGVSAQFNYVLSKVMSDGAGDDQRRLDQAIDNNNLRLERARAPFDLTHVFKGNWNVELPFGAGRRIHGEPAGKPHHRRMDRQRHLDLPLRHAVLDPFHARHLQPGAGPALGPEHRQHEPYQGRFGPGAGLLHDRRRTHVRLTHRDRP